MEQNQKNDQAGFLIFTFKFDIILLEVYYREAIQLHCFATHALREPNSHVYIRCMYYTRIQ